MISSFSSMRLGALVLSLPMVALAIGEHGLAAPPRKTAAEAARDEADNAGESDAKPSDPAELKTATFGAGCFWCSEAVFQQLKGVKSVVSGYSGGVVKNPTYEQVSTGLTGHAEAIQITFDPQAISYDELLEVFWQTHDPTTLNQQGHDVGPQYRSVIFYHDDGQKKLAEHYKRELDKEHAFRKLIVTEIVAFDEFYPAEAYHQNYYNLHRGDAYCSAVIRPKVAKVKKVFKDKLRPEALKPRSR